MTERQATARAPSNIAFIKYWGNRDQALRLPCNGSLSMNLDAATTTTTVTFDEALAGDELTIDGRPLTGAALTRVTAHLDHVRALAGLPHGARVVSSNTFPMGTGIASSASGFAALSLAAAAAAGLELDEPALSALARLGSGSAARSVPGGFVEWRAADAHAESYAWSIAPPEHWDLRDLVAVVSRRHKTVGSTGGHEAASTSPLFRARLAGLEDDLPRVRDALLARDMDAFGPAVEAEALSLHAVAMTSRPPVLYWAPETLDLLHRVQTWRAAGLPVYFTLDAGPNVHLLCEGERAAEVEAALAGLDYVEQVLHNRAAGPAVVVDGAGLA